MKYAREWQTQVQTLPDELGAACISYRGWKKITSRKSAGSDGWDGRRMIERLRHEAAVADRVFRSHARRSYARRTLVDGLACCLGRRHVTPVGVDAEQARQALAFARLNATTLAKICKRMERHAPACGARAWLVAARSSLDFAFLGGYRVTGLQLAVDGAAWECPVCLCRGPELGGEAVLTCCGHAVCAACVRELVGMAGKRGVIWNLIGHGLVAHGPRACPLCRDPRGFQRVRTVCLPAEPPSSLAIGHDSAVRERLQSCK